LEKKAVKKWSKEWLRLFEEKKNLENCLSNLETQRDRVSSDIFNPMLTRYQDQLESLSSLHQEIEVQLESVRKRTSEEIDLLQKELKPIQKRFEEIQSLYQLGGMTKDDFSREKNQMRKEIESKERGLRKYRRIISVLPGNMGGGMASPGIVRNLLQPLPLMLVAVMIIFMGIGGYLFWQGRSPSSSASSHDETEKIRGLFENIRQANLKKNISLFMSCYSRDFEDKKGKRLATLETWESVNYLDLSYDLKKQIITGDTADVSLEWFIRISPKAGGNPQDSRSVLNVTLRREGGDWKIKEIKSAS
jgi:CHASE3 domain sensor protein